MSQLSDFYTLKGTDDQGRTHTEMCFWDWAALEDVHDYIQWLFPLKVASQFNPGAPLLTDEDIELIDLHLVRRSLARMYEFYGIFDIGGLILKNARTWDSRSSEWVTLGNHNFLRITRILKSLSLLGLDYKAEVFLEFLEGLYKLHPDIITETTMNFWREAVQ